MDHVRETLRYSHYARSTEKTYYQWILQSLCFYEKKPPPQRYGRKGKGDRRQEKGRKEKAKDWMVSETH